MTGEAQISLSATDEWAWNTASNPLPQAVDVAIIGGGIVGCSAALYLARDGVSVALFEKGRVAGEQSGRNWGWVRQQGRSPVELPMMMRSLALWKELAQSLGEDIGFTQGGSLYLAETAAELLELEKWIPTARLHGLDTRMLSARELAGVLESDGSTWSGAMYTASDARAEPGRAGDWRSGGASRRASW